MKPIRRFHGIVAPLIRSNIDTDAIIPSREMKRVSRKGLADGLFAAWRYRNVEERTDNPDFVLNQTRWQDATILAAGPNFGCGSSREHAVWALHEYGFRAVLAPSFGAIFERNCYNNGLLPVTQPEAEIQRILEDLDRDPGSGLLTIDLEHQRLETPSGLSLGFQVPEVQREMLLNGWDPIDQTLQHQGLIDSFKERDAKARPWVYRITSKARKTM